MSARSASPAENPRTLVWDAPVRAFHWLLVLGFATAWLSAESERWQLVHVTAGYTMAALVAFRVLWGRVGTRHARFSDFVRGPRAVLAYLKSLVRGRPEHHAGHNPAGALAIVGLLALTLLTVAAGWATYNEIGGKLFEEAHEALATLMLVIVVVHVLAVIVSSRLHRENLVASMIHGRKPVPSTEGIRGARRGVAVVLLATVLGFWWLQWQSAPADALSSATQVEAGDDD